MHTIIELDELSQKLENFRKEFNEQFNSIDNDTREFHNTIINLSKKYPEHSELLEFIVFINDKLETNQTMQKQYIIESINELIRYKQSLITTFKRKASKDIKSDGFNIGSIFNSFKDIKTILILIAFILLFIGFIFFPAEIQSVIDILRKFI